MPALRSRARFDLAGRTALVTGGTARIGLALCRALSNAGVRRMIVVGRDPERLASVVAELGPQTIALGGDLSKPRELNLVVEEVRKIAPDLSVLVNNAGIQRIVDLTADDAARHRPDLQGEINLNLSAAVALTVELLPLLARQRSSAVVNVTSALALAPKASAPVYCATKAGLRGFTQALRHQCEDRLQHVRIVEALPPLVDTAMNTGRGRGKMSADDCAAEVVRGLQRGGDEIFVGKTKLLKVVMSASPRLARRIMRGQ